ncbi:MAG: radical SAM protein [Polyangiaceae bacterium]|nr:radical SAM protein [Polyangiaceae bacterium]
MSSRAWPAYLAIPRAELRGRAERAVAGLARCRVCPRDCDVDRLGGATRLCSTGRFARVSTWYPHFGEEDCLRGSAGSGTIFFSACNLRCVFCQNHDISQAGGGRELSPERLAAAMLDLQRQGCHNVNLVTPEHVVPQILEALPLAVDRGLRLPIVYNTSAYDSLESLRALDGVVDVYLPDFKLWTPERAARYLKAHDYPEAARAALREMHRQVGDLELDERGLARRGVLVRHLVMPDLLGETRAILEFLRDELSPRTWVSLLGQYHPAYRTTRYPEIHRSPTLTELREARRLFHALGLERLDERSPDRVALSVVG